MKNIDTYLKNYFNNESIINNINNNINDNNNISNFKYYLYLTLTESTDQYYLNKNNRQLICSIFYSQESRDEILIKNILN